MTLPEPSQLKAPAADGVRLKAPSVAVLFITLLKVNETGVLADISVRPLAGETALTTGGVGSKVVVKVEAKELARATP